MKYNVSILETSGAVVEWIGADEFVAGLPFDTSGDDDPHPSRDGFEVPTFRRNAQDSCEILDPCFCARRGGKWQVSNGALFIGGGWDTNHWEVECDDFEAAVTVIREYLFGRSEVVRGWEITFHKHPDWNRTRIIAAVGAATECSDDELQRYKRDHVQFGSGVNPSKLLRLFVHWDGKILRFSGDGETAMIFQAVDGPPPKRWTR